MTRLTLLLACFLLACASRRPTSTVPVPELVEPALCEHAVPADECVRCHPELVAGFQRRGDWCPPHELPETQCLECHPDLRFVVLPKLREGADLAFLSTMGEDVPELEPHVVPGKVTVFDFHALWCGPCRVLDAHLFNVLNVRDDVAVRHLNVMSWETPVAKRWLAEVPALPYAIVYGRDGKKVRAISGLDLDALEAAIAEGAAR